MREREKGNYDGGKERIGMFIYKYTEELKKIGHRNINFN